MKRIFQIGEHILLFSLIIIIIYLLNNPKVIVKNKQNKLENKSNLLSMMIEQDDGSYQESHDNVWPGSTYVFNKKLSGCENGSEITWDEDTKSVKVSASSSDKCYAYFDRYNYVKLCLNNEINSFSCDIIKKAQTDKTIIYHDGKADYNEETNFDLEADDYSFRYSGATDMVNNYVCFGTDNCTEQNSDEYLYRIIGVFKNDLTKDYEVKLIKADYSTIDQVGGSGVGSYIELYPWAYISDYQGNNENIFLNLGTYEWESNYSFKDTRLGKENLNTYFYQTYLNDKWRNFIAKHTWAVESTKYNQVINTNAKDAFAYEVGTKESDYQSYIGLIYASDYFYAANSSYWNLPGLDENGYYNDDSTIWYGNDYSKAHADNWLFMGLYEWTISYSADKNHSENYTYLIRNAGQLTSYGAIYNAIRPTFYLKSNVLSLAGMGTKEKPYLLDLKI